MDSLLILECFYVTEPAFSDGHPVPVNGVLPIGEINGLSAIDVVAVRFIAPHLNISDVLRAAERTLFDFELSRAQHVRALKVTGVRGTKKADQFLPRVGPHHTRILRALSRPLTRQEA
jgi:hypothetical protein